MIRLRTTRLKNSITTEKTYAFEKCIVMVGRAEDENELPDLELENSKHKGIQISIEEEEGQFICFNRANDPFTTINDRSFAKKKLVNGDLIEVCGVAYIFEGTPTEKFEPDVGINGMADEELEAMLQQVEELEELMLQVEALEFEPVLHQSPDQTSNLDNTEVLGLNDRKDIDIRNMDPFMIAQPQEPSPGPNSKFEQEVGIQEVIATPQDEEPQAEVEEEPKNRYYRTFISLITGVAILLLTVVAISYTIIKERSEEEEMKAAAAVADVAMALNFAKMNHAKPRNHMWSDSEFLKNNLRAVLAAEYSPLSIVDTHGRFQNSSYMLRVYTGQNLNQFLVIAQPSPSLMQWLVPKSTIIVDSSVMELRKSGDINPLNRLLADAVLDETNKNAIAHFLRQEKQIPLSLLKKYYNNMGFTTPRALALIRPGAENYIYNAMRYHHLGESLMKKAIALYESHDDHNDIPLLVQEINEFMKFPDIVLYTSEGLKTALQGQKAIATFMPKYKLLFGYLQIHSKQGHLLIDQPSIGEDKGNTLVAIKDAAGNEDAEVDSLPLSNDSAIRDILELLQKQKALAVAEIEEQIIRLKDGEMNQVTIAEIAKLEKRSQKLEKQYLKKTLTALSLQSPDMEPETEEKDNDKPLSNGLHEDRELDHPLFYKLKAIRHDRDEKLEKIKAEIAATKETNGTAEPDGNSRKLKLLKAEEELQKEVYQSIAALQQEHREMPISQYLEYLNSAGLELANDNIQIAPAATEEFKQNISAIDTATSLYHLEISVSKAHQLLNMELFPDPTLLKRYQNQVRCATVHKLDQLLLSSQKLLPLHERNASSRQKLQTILKKAWVTDSDEIDYYLSEFDLLQG